ncbi:MAG TPA: NADPH:quinone reductase [Alphaproteobacteria bacterium]|nr:NADPH:quinone reductase [Alphaproteobacteria bacterium]
MRAVRVHEFGAPEVMKLEDVPDPVAGPGEIVIKIEAIGVNPVDTYIRSGVYGVLPELPYTPGGDAGGTVEALGDGVSGFAVGDRVYMAAIAVRRNQGATAEKAAVPAGAIFHLPDNVSFAAGAALGVPYATAYYGLFLRGQAKPGDTLFVHGASGAVGTAAVQMARAYGMTVIGSAGTGKGRQLVLDQGAHHAVDHTSGGYIDEVRTLTGGNGPDLILEMLANINLAKDLDVVAKYGRIVVIGNRGEIQINPRAAMGKNLDVVGLALPNASDDEMALIHAGLRGGLESGVLNPVIGREMAMAEAAAAHHAVLEPGAFGKIVLKP